MNASIVDPYATTMVFGNFWDVLGDFAYMGGRSYGRTDKSYRDARTHSNMNLGTGKRYPTRDF